MWYLSPLSPHRRRRPSRRRLVGRRALRTAPRRVRTARRLFPAARPPRREACAARAGSPPRRLPLAKQQLRGSDTRRSHSASVRLLDWQRESIFLGDAQQCRIQSGRLGSATSATLAPAGAVAFTAAAVAESGEPDRPRSIRPFYLAVVLARSQLPPPPSEPARRQRCAALSGLNRWSPRWSAIDGRPTRAWTMMPLRGRSCNFDHRNSTGTALLSDRRARSEMASAAVAALADGMRGVGAGRDAGVATLSRYVVLCVAGVRHRQAITR